MDIGCELSVADNCKAMLKNEGSTGSLINGRMFHYDLVHDPAASLALASKPGECVCFHFVNANINNPVALHPIAGVWDCVFLNDSPQNILKEGQVLLLFLSLKLLRRTSFGVRFICS